MEPVVIKTDTQTSWLVAVPKSCSMCTGSLARGLFLNVFRSLWAKRSENFSLSSWVITIGIVFGNVNEKKYRMPAQEMLSEKLHAVDYTRGSL